ncbi:MAG TPA: hypothetical protein VMF91_19125 [Bryobacteraceae bacterium]|nr:hypothetical protein [Bryobacteraceae bacterium]
MSSRSIRRAVERQQQKLARKAAQQTSEVSEARLAANRANAQLSTGPTSPDGKAKTSLNAVKTGLTGRTVLLPGDDAALYEAHVSNFMQRHQPANDEEHNLVQSLADTEWRLLRIPSLEMGIYAVGRLEFANLFEGEAVSLRSALIEAHIYLAYHRQLNNLSIQESRLRRQRDKDTAALKQLQSERHSRETALRAAVPKPPLGIGFDFSTREFDFPRDATPESAAAPDAPVALPLAQNAA